MTAVTFRLPATSLNFLYFRGVLILEAMAQATGLLAFKSFDLHPSGNRLYYFASVDKTEIP